jgi:hypothetical protein
MLPRSLVAASNDSIVALGWMARTSTGDVPAIVISLNAGRSFSTPMEIGDPNDRINGSAFAIWVSGKPPHSRVAAAWPVSRDGTRGIALAASADSGRSFTKAVLRMPPDVPADAVTASIAFEPSGSLHVLWLSGTRLWYSRSIGRSMLSAVEIDDRVSPCRIATVAARDGVASVFWFRTFGRGEGEFAYLRATGGERRYLGPVTRVSGEAWGFRGCPDNDPSLLIDRHGAIRFAFRATFPGTLGSSLFTDRSADGKTFRPRTYLDTPGFADSAHPKLATDQDGGLTLAWEGTHNGRRHVMLRHALGAPGGGGGLDGDWMRPAPAITLDSSGAGASPLVVPTNQGVLAAWASGEQSRRGVAIARLTIDELCGSSGGSRLSRDTGSTINETRPR